MFEIMDKNFIVKVVGRGTIGNFIMAFMLIRKAIRMSRAQKKPYFRALDRICKSLVCNISLLNL